MSIPDLSGTRTQLVVIQPTSFCNIDCRYCYLPNRSLSKRMTLTTLSRIFESIFSSSLLARDITIVWHAGEPMTLPLRFYERAFQLIEQFNTQGIQVEMAFQTNGTCINQQWCDFIKQHNITISVSLDGPQHIHNRDRVDRKGKGTFERTMQGVRLLQENGITPGIIMVLTKHALAYPEAIWQFSQDHHLTNLAFNVEEVNGANTQSTLNSDEDIQSYKHFLRRFLELRNTSKRPPYVREVDTLVDRVFHLNRPVYAAENIPLAILSFDYQGNISTFASELLTMTHPHYQNFLLGNVFEGPLEAILTRQKLVEINAQVQSGVAHCRESCSYFDFCGGGSPVNKLSENGTLDSTETMQCRMKIQATMDVVLERLETAENLPEDEEVIM